MSPVTHLLVSWMVANSTKLGRRGRAAVTVAGVIADVDGLGANPEVLTRNTSNPLLWFSEYHHTFHNVTLALAAALGAFVLAGRRWKAALLAFLAFHLHLLGDLLGARGPDGEQWPIPYLLPFSDVWQWRWAGQWELNAWPNWALTALLLLATFYLAWKRGFSPLELVSLRADAAFIRTLRRRFGQPSASSKQV